METTERDIWQGFFTPELVNPHHYDDVLAAIRSVQERCSSEPALPGLFIGSCGKTVRQHAWMSPQAERAVAIAREWKQAFSQDDNTKRLYWQIDDFCGQRQPAFLKIGTFENLSDELEVYVRLSSLQGRMIPKCYGLYTFNTKGLPAMLVLGLLKGHDLSTTCNVLSASSVVDAIKSILHSISDFGVVHGDLAARNFFCLCPSTQEKAVFLLDFGWSTMADTPSIALAQNTLDIGLVPWYEALLDQIN